MASVPVLGPKPVAPLVELFEQAADRRMVDRLLAVVADQILLADIGDVALLRIFGEQMVEGLLLGRADLLGDRLVPFVAVRKFRVDVEDDAPEVEQAMANDLADREARKRH